MAVSVVDLAEFIGASDDDPRLPSALSSATVLIDETLEDAWRAVPEIVRDRLVTEVGAEMYRRSDSPSGSSQYAQFEGGSTPLRGPRDPLQTVWPIIRRYVVAF